MRLPGLKRARTWNPAIWFGIGGMLGSSVGLVGRSVLDALVVAVAFYGAILSLAVTLIPQDKDSR